MIRTLAVISFLAISVSADTLRLKQGGGVQGMLISANSAEVRFETASGGQKTYHLDDVAGIDFAPFPKPEAQPAQAQPQAAAKPASAPKAVVLPAGTEISVRMIDSIEGKATAAGQRYNASIADPVVVGDRVVIPRGANCTVQVVSVDGGKNLNLSLFDVSVQGKAFATSSDFAEVKSTGTSKGKKAARRGVGLGALGAGIGAIAGGGSGAAIGAAVGGGVGAASGAVAKGKDLNVPSETRLLFRLKTPLPLK